MVLARTLDLHFLESAVTDGLKKEILDGRHALPVVQYGGWFHPKAPGREQVSRYLPALRRTAICPSRDGAIPYAEAGSW